ISLSRRPSRLPALLCGAVATLRPHARLKTEVPRAHPSDSLAEGCRPLHTCHRLDSGPGAWGRRGDEGVVATRGRCAQPNGFSPGCLDDSEAAGCAARCCREPSPHALVENRSLRRHIPRTPWQKATALCTPALTWVGRWATWTSRRCAIEVAR